MQYILFVGQDGNFCSRVILIPYEEFLQVRSEDYQGMKKYSRKATIDGVKIDNLLEQRTIWSGDEGRLEIKEYTKICEKLCDYAEWGLEYASEKDKTWLNQSIRPHHNYFNHIKTYDNFREKYNVVDSFLYIELDNKPPYDTVEEMMNDLY